MTKTCTKEIDIIFKNLYRFLFFFFYEILVAQDTHGQFLTVVGEPMTMVCSAEVSTTMFERVDYDNKIYSNLLE